MCPCHHTDATRRTRGPRDHAAQDSKRGADDDDDDDDGDDGDDDDDDGDDDLTSAQSRKHSAAHSVASAPNAAAPDPPLVPVPPRNDMAREDLVC